MLFADHAKPYMAVTLCNCYQAPLLRAYRRLLKANVLLQTALAAVKVLINVEVTQIDLLAELLGGAAGSAISVHDQHRVVMI